MRRLIPLLTAACLTACGGGDMSNNSAMMPPMQTPAAKTNFTAFTEKLVSSQTETEEPVSVAVADFYFPDDDNESAFAAVVPAI